MIKKVRSYKSKPYCTVYSVHYLSSESSICIFSRFPSSTAASHRSSSPSSPPLRSIFQDQCTSVSQRESDSETKKGKIDLKRGQRLSERQIDLERGKKTQRQINRLSERPIDIKRDKQTWREANTLREGQKDSKERNKIWGKRDQNMVLQIQKDKDREKLRDTDKCILFDIWAGIYPAVPIHLACSIDTRAIQAKSTFSKRIFPNSQRQNISNRYCTLTQIKHVLLFTLDIVALFFTTQVTILQF